MTAVWIVLIVMSSFGFLLGLVYYYKPEYIVSKRVKKVDSNLNDNDPEYQTWLKKEAQAQIIRTKKIGKMLAIFELFWLVIIVFLFIRYVSTG